MNSKGERNKSRIHRIVIEVRDRIEKDDWKGLKEEKVMMKMIMIMNNM